ncbi:hypothetical protein [Argonema antarcticum]|uniref:hypothetical protein n=1 Tax=Argonema antarcticum TaxID=2942763 RepID=UPI00201143DC|nr:hypothetical protein [Argonema antarcticum]MCL1469148.1 hypothetical protein [Argonema antarcticum A004/B2]
MKRTIELPEELADLLEQYLKENSPSGLILYMRERLGIFEPEYKDLSELLAVAGMIKDSHLNQEDFSEDSF